MGTAAHRFGELSADMRRGQARRPEAPRNPDIGLNRSWHPERIVLRNAAAFFRQRAGRGRDAMRAGWTLVVLALVAGAMHASSAQRELTAAADVEVLLEAALHKEQVEGRLAEAIEGYQGVIARAGANRALAVKALLHLARSQEKSGDDRARGTYRQIVEQYADQPATSAAARAALTPLAPAAAQAGNGTGVVSEKVWDGEGADRYGSISLDGRYLSYMDPKTGDLAVRDLVTKQDRRVTSHPAASNEYAEYSVFSPDGSQLAYGWGDRDDRYSLRRISRDGGEPTVLIPNSEAWLMPYDWSPDGREILAIVVRNRTRQLVFVSAADGSVRSLKTLEWNMGVPNRAEFSPDGRWVAYDRRETGGARNVFVVAVDGSHEETIVTGPSNDMVLGWFPDGGTLFVSSDRTGSPGGYAVDVRDGRPSSELRLITPDLGQITPYRFTNTGDFFYFLRVGVPDINIATIDPETGKTASGPVPLPHRSASGRVMPAWSPDGSRLAYRDLAAPTALVIQHLASGAVRTIPLQLSYANAVPAWMPDGQSLLTPGADLDARLGLFSIDPATGAARRIAEGLTPAVQVAPDGERMFYSRVPREGVQPALTLRNRATGTERDVYVPVERRIAHFELSADGRWIALRTIGPDGTNRLEILPAEGGATREILQDAQQVRWGGFDWTPDGRSVFLARADALWRIPVDGGPPHKLDVALPAMARVTVHPDGRRVAVVNVDAKGEIWTRQNLSAAARQGR
jgi:Tol biopolymer transport system component